MLNTPVLLLLGALIAGWIGFGVLTGGAARVVKLLAVVLLVLFAVTMFRAAAAG